MSIIISIIPLYKYISIENLFKIKQYIHTYKTLEIGFIYIVSSTPEEIFLYALILFYFDFSVIQLLKIKS